jgi:hypothetical protein
MKYKGVATHRFDQNPIEKEFAEAWDRQNVVGNTLEYLMGDGTRRGVVSERDEIVAATVIQWLGSPVGQAFLRDLGFAR